MQVMIRGKVTEQAELRVYQKERLSELLRPFIGREVEIIIKSPDKAVSNKQRGYWYGVVLKEVHKGFRGVGYNMTLTQVEEFLRDNFLVVEDVDGEEGKVIQMALTFDDDQLISPSTFREIVSRVQQYASENLNHYIPDPV